MQMHAIRQQNAAYQRPERNYEVSAIMRTHLKINYLFSIYSDWINLLNICWTRFDAGVQLLIQNRRRRIDVVSWPCVWRRIDNGYIFYSIFCAVNRQRWQRRLIYTRIKSKRSQISFILIFIGRVRNKTDGSVVKMCQRQLDHFC